MKLSSILAVVSMTGVCLAQDFGASADGSAAQPETASAAEPAVPQEFVESQDGAMAAEQAAMEEEPKTAVEALNNLLSTKYADSVSAVDRIVVLQKIEFNVQDPDVGTEFLDLRASKMAELLLQAKVQIAQTIFSRMSAEQILEKPYSPLAAKYKDKIEAVKSELKTAYNNLARLGVVFEQVKLEKKAPNKDAFELATDVGSWLAVAKGKNIALQLDSNKKKFFDAAEKKHKEAVATLEELKADAEAEKPKIQKEMKTNMSRATEMQMHGGVVLEQAEDYSEPDENGKVKCTMAVIYSWSEETQNAAAAVLDARPLKLMPGKNTLRGWLDKKAKNGALAQWLGPRRYIDNEGNLWFIGIAAAPVSDDSAEQETNEQIAELKSSTEVGFALYADVASKKALEEVYRETKANPNEPMTPAVSRAYSEKLSQGFKDLQIFGLKKVYTKELKDDASGQNIIVIVSAVNASNARAMKDVQAKAHKLGVDINLNLQRERGRQDRMREQTIESRTDRNAYNSGRRQADRELQEHNARKRARPAKITTPTSKPSADATRPVQGPSRGRLRGGVKIHIDDDDE